jgi:eukaryotic-like serine/threonine-protein kinase
MPLQPGSRIGAYDIVSLLGAGGMGEVYRARDIRLDRIVAVKSLTEQCAADGDRVVFHFSAELSGTDIESVV